MHEVSYEQSPAFERATARDDAMSQAMAAAPLPPEGLRIYPAQAGLLMASWGSGHSWRAQVFRHEPKSDLAGLGEPASGVHRGASRESAQLAALREVRGLGARRWQRKRRPRG